MRNQLSPIFVTLKASFLGSSFRWYLRRQNRVEQATGGAYRQWIVLNFAHRGGAAR